MANNRRTFKGAALAVIAQIKMRKRFHNGFEDPKNPYTNHSETDDSSDDEDEVFKDLPVIPIVIITENGLVSSPRPSLVKIKKSQSAWRRYRGMLLALLSSFIFALAALLAKKLHHFHPFSIALWRFQGALVPVIPVIAHKILVHDGKDKLLRGLWPITKIKDMGLLGLVLLRSALSCNSYLLLLYSLKYVGMGDALTIASSTPILVAILARIFLGERCGVVTIVASVCTLVGVVLMTKPPVLTGAEAFDADTLIGSALALGCMILAATSYCVLRYIRTVHYLTTTLLFGVWGVAENLVLAISFNTLNLPNDWSEWALIVGLAMCTFFGQFAIILAMKAEQAGPVALVRTFDVIFGFAGQIIFLKLMPDIFSIIGSTIIVLAVLVCGFRKWLRGLSIGHPTRARFRYLML